MKMLGDALRLMIDSLHGELKLQSCMKDDIGIYTEAGPCFSGPQHQSSEFSKRSFEVPTSSPSRHTSSTLNTCLSSFPPIPHPIFTLYIIMLQRTILRASRQRIAAFAPLRQPLVSTRVAATPAVRWYSDAPAAKEGEAAEKKEDAAPANDEAAKLKTDIEKKDKEIVELKV
jgi:hypothetical protein